MEETEKGSDERLYEVATREEVLEPTLEDDERRRLEEERTRAQPSDGNLG